MHKTIQQSIEFHATASEYSAKGNRIQYVFKDEPITSQVFINCYQIFREKGEHKIVHQIFDLAIKKTPPKDPKIPLRY